MEEHEIADVLKRGIEGLVRDSADFADKLLSRCLAELEASSELSDSELDQVSGGAWSTYGVNCPECKKVIKLSSNESQEVTCPSCGHSFTLILSK